jgi:uncharacterized membrane-anchored protein
VSGDAVLKLVWRLSTSAVVDNHLKKKKGKLCDSDAAVLSSLELLRRMLKMLLALNVAGLVDSRDLLSKDMESR